MAEPCRVGALLGAAERCWEPSDLLPPATAMVKLACFHSSLKEAGLLGTNSRLAVSGVRLELMGARAGPFHKIAMKYLVGVCFCSCLLAGALKTCGEGQMFGLSPCTCAPGVLLPLPTKAAFLASEEALCWL